MALRADFDTSAGGTAAATMHAGYLLGASFYWLRDRHFLGIVAICSKFRFICARLVNVARRCAVHRASSSTSTQPPHGRARSRIIKYRFCPLDVHFIDFIPRTICTNGLIGRKQSSICQVIARRSKEPKSGHRWCRSLCWQNS